MSLPTKVKIGVQVFDIVERAVKQDGMLHDGSYGYTLDSKNVIILDKDMHITKKRVTLFHEVMHAARMVFENTTKPSAKASFEDWEHHFIGIWENSLLMIFKENPDLLAYLLGEDETPKNARTKR